MPIIKSPIEYKDVMNSEESIRILYPEITLDDLIVPNFTLYAIQDFLAYQKYKSLIFDDWGLSETHKNKQQIAINLYGLPGTGKTMAAHAIAHALNKPIIAVNYSEIESKYVGETSKNISALFEQAKNSNAIIFFDEADAILSRRVTDMSSATDVSVNQTRSVLLTLMNNHEGLIIFTTNFIENYDPAFMRRILSHILFELPCIENRERLWRKYIPQKLPIITDIRLLAENSNGLSGSDISNCVLKAAMSAARSGDSSVGSTHFDDAINEVKASQNANKNLKYSLPSEMIKENIVSESYVKSQLNNKQIKDLKND